MIYIAVFSTFSLLNLLRLGIATLTIYKQVPPKKFYSLFAIWCINIFLIASLQLGIFYLADCWLPADSGNLLSTLFAISLLVIQPCQWKEDRNYIALFPS